MFSTPCAFCLYDMGKDKVGDTYKTKALGYAVGSSPDVRRLYFCGVDFANDAPGGAIYEAEEEHGDNDDPSRDAVGMDRSRCVERTDQKHCHPC